MRTSRASINASGHREQWRGPYKENACESVGERAHGGSLTNVMEPPCVVSEVNAEDEIRLGP